MILFVNLFNSSLYISSKSKSLTYLFVFFTHLAEDLPKKEEVLEVQFENQQAVIICYMMYKVNWTTLALSSHLRWSC